MLAHNQLKKLQGVRLEMLMREFPRYCGICKANMCSSCEKFEETGEMKRLQESLKAHGVPHDVYECRNDPQNRNFLLSTGTSNVPCIVWIQDGVSKYTRFQSFTEKPYAQNFTHTDSET